jgi:ABC-type glycerol-3-phosphate transport system substrate-binding protein
MRTAITRRRMTGGAAASAAAAVAAACGLGQGTGQSGAGGPGAATGAASTGAGRVEFWQLYQNSPAAGGLKDLFQRKHPDIQVEWVDTPAGQQPQKLTVAVASGTPPDMTSITTPYFRDCARFYQPLDPYLKRDGKQIDANDWLPLWQQASVIKGKTLGLPLEVAVRVWWFNTPLLAERGVPSPVRSGAPAKVGYKQVEEWAQQLTFNRADKPVYGLWVARTWHDILLYVSGFGGKFLDADHTKCLLDSPEATAGIEYAFDLVDKRGYGPATGGIGVYEAEGTLAMALSNAARAQNLRKEQYGVQWDTGPVVQGPAAPMTFAFVHQTGIVKDCRNPEGAWRIAGEYTGKDANRLWMKGHGWPTARKSYLELYIKEGEAPPTTRQNVMEWIKVSPVVTFPVGYTANVLPIAQRIIGEMNGGQRTPKDAAAALGREITAALQA